MDKRIYLPEAYQLRSERQLYIIDRALSSGSNSIVYQAHYQDNLMPDHIHLVLIKELYPWEPIQRITRADPPEHMELLVPEESASLFSYHRESFLMGNQAHLILSEEGNDFVAGNLDSFAANRTLYTVLTNRNGQVLSEVLKEQNGFCDLRAAVRCIRNILYALQPFHSHRMLHLDISPDNIFLLKPSVPGKEAPEEVLLLDFNSVYSLDGDLSNECRYYLGKQDYMAPEVRLHNTAALGPWTDLYSVCAVFYEIVSGRRLPEDMELSSLRRITSVSMPMLEKVGDAASVQTRKILTKGLSLLSAKRYQSAEELIAELGLLLRLLDDESPRDRHYQDKTSPGGGSPPEPGSELSLADSGRLPRKPGSHILPENGDCLSPAEAGSLSPISERGRSPASDGRAGSLKFPRRLRFWVPAGLLAILAVFFLTAFPPRDAGINVEVSAGEVPIKKDDSIVISRINIRNPLPDNLLELPLNTSTTVRATLKDFTHPKDPSQVFPAYSIAPFYNGEGDARGWQGGEFYDFFNGRENTLHFTMPLNDPGDFDLEYVVLAAYNYNYDNSRVLLDVSKYTLTDGAGNSYEITDLLGSHILYFTPDQYIWYLMTTQNDHFVKNFDDIRGGSIEVETTLNLLDPLLEVTWKSEDPSVAAVDDAGVITPVSQGYAVITLSILDKTTGEERSTQMLVHILPPV